MWLLGGREAIECPEQVQSNGLQGIPVHLCVFLQLTVAATLPLIILQILLRKHVHYQGASEFAAQSGGAHGHCGDHHWRGVQG